MVELIVAVILALISYFSAKKNGASTSEAALIGAAAGAGSYYVATQTDWGKSLFSDAATEWEIAKDDAGNTVVDEAGNTVYVPKGEKVTLDAAGKIVKAADGTWFTKTLDTTGKVLSSWGGTGTAAVIGTAAAASGSGIFGDLKPYLPLIIGGVAVFLLVR